MAALVADTHAAIWYFSGSPKLSPAARAAFDQAILAGAPLHLASISLVEACYLVEKGRLPTQVLQRLYQLSAGPRPRVTIVPLDRTIARMVERVPRSEVPEMPDRIIAATALHLGLPLVTRDLRIRAVSVIQTIW